MTWDAFYENYIDWAESTARTRISSLKDIGPGNEVLEVIVDLPTRVLKEQMLRKAMKLGVQFSADDFSWLDDEVSPGLYRELSEYTGYDMDDPCFDEANMTWNDFFQEYDGWSEETLTRRIGLLKKLGPVEEVVEVLGDLIPETCADMLYKKAMAQGLKFTAEQLVEIGRADPSKIDWSQEVETDEESQQFAEDLATVYENLLQIEENMKRAEDPPRKKKKGLFGAFLLALLSSSGRKKGTGRCDGNCATCPPHYGYRYGRWYYGHGHRHGCQRGGNGGARGICFRD